MNSDGLRPPIPDPIKRQVRKKYRFGCAACGSPIFDYDHIVEFSVVQEHELENLILLCPNHHSSKTRRRLSIERLLYYKDHPHNQSGEFSSTYDLDKSSSVKVEVGFNFLYWTPETENSNCYVVWISGESHFTLHCNDGWITFSMLLTDEKGVVLLHVDHGQMRVSSDVWDYEYVGTRLKVREKLGVVILDLDLANDEVLLHTACFVSGGMGWQVKDKFMHTIGTQGQIATFGSSAHIRGTDSGMYGLINKGVFRQLTSPGFSFLLEQSIVVPAYIFFTAENDARLKAGEIQLKPLARHWASQDVQGGLSEEEQAVAKDYYYIDLFTNERLSAPAESFGMTIPNPTPFFHILSQLVPVGSECRAEVVAYVPEELLKIHRAAPYGVFVEPDYMAYQRCIRFVLRVPDCADDFLILKGEALRPRNTVDRPDN